MVGVYFLKQGNTVVYVGSSNDVKARIKVHENNLEKVFNSYQVIECDEEELCNLESYYTYKFDPIFNKNKRKAVKPEYSIVWVLAANKNDKKKVLAFVKECLFFPFSTPEELSIKHNLSLEDSEDLFLCRTIKIDTLTTYFKCKQKALIYDDVILERCEFNDKKGKSYGSYVLR